MMGSLRGKKMGWEGKEIEVLGWKLSGKIVFNLYFLKFISLEFISSLKSNYLLQILNWNGMEKYRKLLFNFLLVLLDYLVFQQYKFYLQKY